MGDPSAAGPRLGAGHRATPGLFWTIPIRLARSTSTPAPARRACAPVGEGRRDYHDFFNAVFGGGPTPLPSRVSFDVRWAGDGARQKIRDSTFGFVGDYVPSTASISFVAMDDHGGVIYRSDPGGQTNVGQRAVGTERNGVFFH